MTQNALANTALSIALPELFLSWIPASAGTTTIKQAYISKKPIKKI